MTARPVLANLLAEIEIGQATAGTGNFTTVGISGYAQIDDGLAVTGNASISTDLVVGDEITARGWLEERRGRRSPHWI